MQAQTSNFGYCTLPVTPLLHAVVGLDEKFTINLALWDKIDNIVALTYTSSIDYGHS